MRAISRWRIEPPLPTLWRGSCRRTGLPRSYENAPPLVTPSQAYCRVLGEDVLMSEVPRYALVSCRRIPRLLHESGRFGSGMETVGSEDRRGRWATPTIALQIRIEHRM